MEKARKVTPEMYSEEAEARAKQLKELDRSIHGGDRADKALLKGAQEIVDQHLQSKSKNLNPREAFDQLFN